MATYNTSEFKKGLKIQIEGDPYLMIECNFVKPGKGQILINDKPAARYFARPVLRMLITQPFLVADRYQQFDVNCTVVGGGLSGQAGAVRHGISRALTNYEPELRAIPKKAGFLTRDPRVVERKKYGKAKARRSFQFSKR